MQLTAANNNNKVPFSVAISAFVLFSFACGRAGGQEPRPDLRGMWSDPPPTPEDYFCYAYCTDTGIDRLMALLDDPANDERSYSELSGEASAHQREAYIVPHLSDQALASYPLDPADDPGFLYCEPWGLARQMFAPHQLRISQLEDRVEFHYGEWEARRTIYLDGRSRPAGQAPSLLGFSVGRYEGETLVVETTGVSANQTMWRSEHGDGLRTIERYSRSQDGQRLLLTATLEDPEGFREPLTLRKVWSFAPEQEIFPYVDCEPPTEFSRGVDP